MKSWHRYAITLVGGLAVGLGCAWALTGGGLSDGAIRNGPWTTSLGSSPRRVQCHGGANERLQRLVIDLVATTFLYVTRASVSPRQSLSSLTLASIS